MSSYYLKSNGNTLPDPVYSIYKSLNSGVYSHGGVINAESQIEYTKLEIKSLFDEFKAS